jgi:hypothetical protein
MMNTEHQLYPLVGGIAPERVDSLEIPSKKLLGVLPLRRMIPQDVHSIADYANGVLAGGGFFISDCTAAKVGSAVLGSSIIGVSLLTDYRLSAAKVIPIEMHEVADYAWGASAIAMPFVLGYWKRDPITAIGHVVCGAMTIVTSLLTDYRAARGVGRRFA